MGTKEFLEQLRNSRASKNYMFIMVTQSDDEMSVAVCDKNSRAVECSFTYERTGLIYNMAFGNISFYRLRDLLNTIDEILE